MGIKMKYFYSGMDSIGTPVCLSFVCLSFLIRLFSVFRIVNETSIKASLAPIIGQLLYTNNWSGALQAYSVQRLD